MGQIENYRESDCKLIHLFCHLFPPNLCLFSSCRHYCQGKFTLLEYVEALDSLVGLCKCNFMEVRDVFQ